MIGGKRGGGGARGDRYGNTQRLGEIYHGNIGGGFFRLLSVCLGLSEHDIRQHWAVFK